MNTFLKGLMKEDAKVLTENGAVTHNTTLNSVLDYFAQCGALRGQDENRIKTLFDNAYLENPDLALKILFYSRDIRGGLGERDVFRTLLRHLAHMYTDVLDRIIHYIPDFGRWDDLFCLFDTPCEKQALRIIHDQWNMDIFCMSLEDEHISLLGKWLPSENASSKQSKYYAKKIMNYMKITPKHYRKTLVALRKKINIVETKIHSKNYKDIEYSQVPSKALIQYNKAYTRNDQERYNKFFEDLKEGKTTVNVGTLYPYDLIRQIMNGTNTPENVDVLWNNLPNYVKDDSKDILVVPDMSQSMTWENDGLAYYMAISLAVYYSERNRVFHNLVMTFATNPKLVNLGNGTLKNKINNLEKADVGYSTDIKSVFDLILQTAINNKLTSEELPYKVVMISDMEFNEAEGYNNNYNESLFKIIEKEYKANGYIIPKLVFWNVNARQNNFPVTNDEMNVQYVSGGSARNFEIISKDLTAEELMLEVLNSERYVYIKKYV